MSKLICEIPIESGNGFVRIEIDGYSTQDEADRIFVAGIAQSMLDHATPPHIRPGCDCHCVPDDRTACPCHFVIEEGDCECGHVSIGHDSHGCHHIVDKKDGQECWCKTYRKQANT